MAEILIQFRGQISAISGTAISGTVYFIPFPLAEQVARIAIPRWCLGSRFLPLQGAGEESLQGLDEGVSPQCGRPVLA